MLHTANEDGPILMTLSVNHLHIEFPGTLLFEDVSFNVSDHEILAIESRILDGGTSLLYALGGMLGGVNGQVELDGESLLNDPPEKLRYKVGYVYEARGLVSLYTVYQNIILPLQFHTDSSPSQIGQRLNHVCELLGLDRSLYNLRTHQLNDVQTRVVNLARALIVDPRLLLIDELEGGMSDEFISATMAVLRAFQKECPMSIVMSTASELIMQSADRVLRIENNCLVEVDKKNNSAAVLQD